MPEKKELNSLQIGQRDREAIRHLKEAIASGKQWYLALLEAIGMWESAEEDYNGRYYSYLIAGEAFDWLLLAERLCQEIDDLIPEKEKIDLLFFDRPPIELTKEEFKNLIGPAKYRAYLNYLYGVLVEELLVLAVIEEIRKERRTSGLNEDRGTTEQAYQRIYGSSMDELLKQFRKERDYPQLESISLSELKEFRYWLFKYRLKRCEKVKVASDTKKALMQLHQQLAQKVRNVKLQAPCGRDMARLLREPKLAEQAYP